MASTSSASASASAPCSKATDDAASEPDKKRRRTDESAGEASDLTKIVRLQVGHRRELVLRSTLTRFPDSVLGRLFSDDKHTFDVTEDGAIFLDRDPKAFRGMLSFLRSGVVPFVEHNESLNTAIAAELDYWGLAFGAGAAAPIDAGADADAVADEGPFSDRVRVGGAVVAILLGGTDYSLARRVARAICKDVPVSWPKSPSSMESSSSIACVSEGLIKCLPKTYAWIVHVTADPSRGHASSPRRPPDHRWSDLDFSPMIFKVERNGTSDGAFVSVYYRER